MANLAFLPLLLLLLCCAPFISSSDNSTTVKESSHSAPKTEVLSQNHSSPSPKTEVRSQNHTSHSPKTEVHSHSVNKTSAPSSPGNKNEEYSLEAVQLCIKKADSLSWYMDDMISNKSTTQKDRQAAQTCADKLHTARAPMKQPGFSLTKLVTFLQGLNASETECLNLVNKFEVKSKAVVDAANNACITTNTAISMVKQTSQSPPGASKGDHGPSSPANKNDGAFEAVQMSMTYANSLSWCMNGIISNKSTTQKDRQAAQTCAGRLHTVMAPAKNAGFDYSKLVAFLERLIASETDCLNSVKNFEVKIPSVENEATNALQISNTAMAMVKKNAPSSSANKNGSKSDAPSSPANKDGGKSDAPSSPANKNGSKSDAPSSPANKNGGKSEAPSSPANKNGSKSDAPSSPANKDGSKSDAPSSPANKDASKN